MLGETTAGTWVAYGAIILLLIVLVVMFLRVVFMASLLLIVPVAELLRRLPGFRRLTRWKEPPTPGARGGDPPGAF